MKKIAKSGKFDANEFWRIIEGLCRDDPPDKKYKDHALIGEWSGCRELHIRPDCLFVYRLKPDVLELVRIGFYAELFG